MFNCHTCHKAIEAGKWTQLQFLESQDANANKYGRYGPRGVFFLNEGEKGWINSYCLFCYNIAIGKKAGVPGHEANVKRLTKQRDDLLKLERESRETIAGMAQDNKAIIQTNKELCTQIKNKQDIIQQLQERQSYHDAVNAIYHDSCVVSMMSFISSLSEPDRATLRCLGFTTDVHSSLRESHLTLSKDLVQTTATSIAKYCTTHLQELSSTLHDLQNILDTTQKSLESVKIPQQAKDAAVEGIRAQITDTEAHIARWTEHKLGISEFTQQQQQKEKAQEGEEGELEQQQQQQQQQQDNQGLNEGQLEAYGDIQHKNDTYAGQENNPVLS
eukprot:TRINITY_DN34755_c0_g1_i1.p1 TRINITY_DN34755_c0_g1~~TRINITY_DN34755_c0_g1_i1.p1  ORF type:complete len:340 (+),score=83.77 TRINITY_DN34755_c0_g1_i1:32-1021(+)